MKHTEFNTAKSMKADECTISAFDMMAINSIYARRNMSNPYALKESNSRDYSLFSERHIQCIWYDSRLRPAHLVSSTGEDIFVESPGAWNLEAGPDFLDAVVRIEPGRRIIRGDVEIHINPQDWRQHDHASDPRYSKVMLHVCYNEGILDKNELPAGAIEIPLRNVLQSNPVFSFDSIDISAYPYANLPAEKTLCSALISGKSPDFLAYLLRSAGQERLRLKSLRMAEAMTKRGDKQVLYEEIMTALGYKQNKNAFRYLAHILPLSLLQDKSHGDPEKAYAIMLGVSGLMPSDLLGISDDTVRSFLRRLWDEWWKNQSILYLKRMNETEWNTQNIRPANNPARRMAAAASLFATNDFIDSIISVPTDGTWFATIDKIIEERSKMDFWSRRLSIHGKEMPQCSAIVGHRRRTSIMMNTIIPFLAATGNDISMLLDRIPPEDDNSIIRITANLLLGRDHNHVLLDDGLFQQGLLQIFHDHCINRRPNCSNCTLVEKLSVKPNAN